MRALLKSTPWISYNKAQKRYEKCEAASPVSAQPDFYNRDA